MDRDAKQRELATLQQRARELEAELAAAEVEPAFPPHGYYSTYHVLAGCVLGLCAASTSLLFNVVGSLIVGQHPLELIRIYLTFPLGESALKLGTGQSSLILAIGCCLYLATGMVLGVPFQLILTRYLAGASTVMRLGAVTVMAMAIWIVNFYLILSWVQPLWFGGRWIVELIPWWIGALTHLVFGWTMLLAQPLGRFQQYQLPPEVERT
jgi:hypothetical protein